MLVLTFQIGHDRLALDIRRIREVVPRVQLNRVAAAPLGIPGYFNARAEYQFVGSRYSDVQNSPGAKMEAYHIVNGQIGWEKDNLKIYAFARNLLDERPLSYAFTYAPGATVNYVGRGRVVGVGTSVTW